MNFKATRSTPVREEKAFSDDVAAGPLGGFIWPPRSYSCSFCKKEFKSAQALGGHMNVHRRDRARLKQYQNEDVLVNHQNHIHKYPPWVWFKLDTNLDTNATIASTDHSPSRASTVSTQENFNKHTQVFVEEQPKAFFPSSPLSRSDSEAAMLLGGRLDSKARFEKSPRKEDFTFLGVEDCVETNLSVGLNFVIPRNQPTMPLVHKPGSNDPRYPFQKEVLVEIFKGSSILEDIDLELRLGDPPN